MADSPPFDRDNGASSDGVRSNSARGAEASATRRRFIKGAAATAGGALAAAYVKPSLKALGVPSALAMVSGPPPPPPTPVPLQGCSPGYWGNPSGGPRWNTANDPNWGGAGANPFIHTTLFNSFFTSWSSLNGLTMMDIVGNGGGPDPARQAARQLIAAYLSAKWGMSYAYTPVQLVAMWNNAVSAGTASAFDGVRTTLDPYNGGSAALCPL